MADDPKAKRGPKQEPAMRKWIEALPFGTLGRDWPDLDLGQRPPGLGQSAALPHRRARRLEVGLRAQDGASRRRRWPTRCASCAPTTRARRRGPCSPTGADGRCATRRSSTACGPPPASRPRSTGPGSMPCGTRAPASSSPRGRSPVQIAAWLGHHSPAFSMAVYGHLMDDGVGEGLHLTPPVVAA